VNPAKTVLFAAFVALLSVGCPGITQPLEKPTVTLRGVSVTSVSLAGLDSRFEFSLTNPNSIGLPLSALDWELSIGGAAAVRGRATLSEKIPAKGSAPVDVDVHISARAAVEMGSRIAAGATDYHLLGTLHFQTSLADLAVSFDQTGSLGDLP
jgi:LEA14-like dessication related protein